MSPRFLLILSFLTALVACGGGSKTDTASDSKTDSGEKKTSMAGYKLPDSIDVLETEE